MLHNTAIAAFCLVSVAAFPLRGQPQSLREAAQPDPLTRLAGEPEPASRCACLTGLEQTIFAHCADFE